MAGVADLAVFFAELLGVTCIAGLVVSARRFDPSVLGRTVACRAVRHPFVVVRLVGEVPGVHRDSESPGPNEEQASGCQQPYCAPCQSVEHNHPGLQPIGLQ